MKFYRINRKTLLEVNDCQEGEPIEIKVERILTNGEPITDGAPILYTERDDGVLPEYNPRTDKWEIAIDAMDKVHKTEIAKRNEKALSKEAETKENGGAESTQATENQPVSE